MKKKIMALCLVSAVATYKIQAQVTETQSKEEKIQFDFYDGTVIGGYVDQGGFLNFTGPNVSYAFGKSKVMAGMLPSLRFKDDKSAVKNAFVTPTLGMGITYSYKKLALQLPLYYNTKTATANGKWHLGIGVGLKLK